MYYSLMAIQTIFFNKLALSCHFKKRNVKSHLDFFLSEDSFYSLEIEILLVGAYGTLIYTTNIKSLNFIWSSIATEKPI